MYGQGHRYCENCGHAVRSGARGCTGCGTSFAGLLMLDEVIDGGMGMGTIGYDPMDGQFAFNLGDGLAIEPDGQVDVDFGGLDFPV